MMTNYTRVIKSRGISYEQLFINCIIVKLPKRHQQVFKGPL